MPRFPYIAETANRPKRAAHAALPVKMTNVAQMFAVESFWPLVSSSGTLRTLNPHPDGNPMTKRELLGQIDFGQRIAEEEGAALAGYFVETDNWRRLSGGEIDVVYGPKGSGKSALYSLLVTRTNDLFDQRILLAPAENPRGTPAFSDLVADPPASEREFVSLWKIYLLSLLCGVFEEYGFRGDSATEVRAFLEGEGLLRGKSDLKALVRRSFDYVKSFFRPPAAVEYGVKVDPYTQHPTGFTRKIIFAEPSVEAANAGVRSVDYLLTLANRALGERDSYTVWIILDRLDVAFVESTELEKNALRALFRVYLDLAAHDRIRLKIFLRDDIWRRITQSGFREASHITRAVTISWDRSSLLNLMVQRILHNQPILRYYQVSREGVLDTLQNQEDFFYRLFPEQVESGTNKSSTVDWMLDRTSDGTQHTAPREVIHLLNTLRTRQVERFQLGQPEPDGDLLFEQATFKEALPEVSRVRLTQTLYAEYPALRQSLEELRGKKTSQTARTLAAVWKISPADAEIRAEELVQIGFFERRSASDAPQYWVPFLYRDALEMVQGQAD